MGCSATKTVPQELSTSDKGARNGDILKTHKDADAKCNTSSKENENVRQTQDTCNNQNGGQTAGQTGEQTSEQTSEKTSEQTGDHTAEEVKNKISTEISLSKDLGMRKLQRKETPQAGPLALNNKAISQSQMEFFKLLDEKIEKGDEFEEGDEVT